MRIRSKALLCLVACIAPALATAQQPIADFIGRPAYGTAKISPDGKYLAMTVDKGEQDVLVVLRTVDMGPIKINQLPDKKSIGDFHWVSGERLMFTAIA